MNPVTIQRGYFISELKQILGERSFVLITSSSHVKSGRVHQIQQAFPQQCKKIFHEVSSHPHLDQVKEVYEIISHHIQSEDVFVGLGGGSVLDFTKALAALVGMRSLHQMSSTEFLNQHVIHAQPFDKKFQASKIILIPTTTGTGSEVTMWGTLWGDGQKYSISHPSLYPEHAILDVELTYSLPFSLTVTTGLDALSHSLEAFWNINATSESDDYALQAIRLLSQNMLKINDLFEGNNQNSLSEAQKTIRKNLQEASLLAGLAFSQTKTALAHSLSYPLTSHYGLAHGIACSFTLAEIFQLFSNHDPKRGQRLNEAFQKTSSEQVYNWFYELFKKLNIQDILLKHLPSIQQIESQNHQWIEPSRASHFVVPMKSDEAFDIIRKALKTIIE